MTYTPDLLAHYKDPHNRGALDAPTHAHVARNPLCGDELRVELVVEDGRVVDVAFDGVGCAISVASASIQTDGWRGQGVALLSERTDADAVAALGTSVAPARHACAGLVLKALRGALESP